MHGSGVGVALFVLEGVGVAVRVRVGVREREYVAGHGSAKNHVPLHEPSNGSLTGPITCRFVPQYPLDPHQPQRLPPSALLQF